MKFCNKSKCYYTIRKKCQRYMNGLKEAGKGIMLEYGEFKPERKHTDKPKCSGFIKCK